jgi:hypothetical protein
MFTKVSQVLGVLTWEQPQICGIKCGAFLFLPANHKQDMSEISSVNNAKLVSERTDRYLRNVG